MEDTNYGFCNRCGTKVPREAVFCPECGAQLQVMPQQTTQQYYASNPVPTQSKTLLWAKILLIAYGAIALLSGLICITLGRWSVETLEATDPATLKTLLDSYGMTKDEYIRVAEYSGIVTAISGALALVSAVLCFKRKQNKVAVAICVVASLICFAELFSLPSDLVASNIISTLISVIIGCIVAFLIYKSREEFDS